MGIHLVDQDLPGSDGEGLAGAQRAAMEVAERLRGGGKPVRYIRSTFIPGERHCMSLFGAPTPELVKEVNDTAGLPYTRIAEAMDPSP